MPSSLLSDEGSAVPSSSLSDEGLAVPSSSLSDECSPVPSSSLSDEGSAVSSPSLSDEGSVVPSPSLSEEGSSGVPFAVSASAKMLILLYLLTIAFPPSLFAENVTPAMLKSRLTTKTLILTLFHYLRRKKCLGDKKCVMLVGRGSLSVSPC